MHGKFSEVWTSGFGDMLADRSQYSAPLLGRNKKMKALQNVQYNVNKN